MDNKRWYSQLNKPKWSPPSWLFGTVWSFLYILIVISFGWVFIELYRNNIGFIIVLPFILNIIFNILLLIITLVWLMVSIYTYYPWVTYIQIPYLLWGLFAFGLQVEITGRNWGN